MTSHDISNFTASNPNFGTNVGSLAEAHQDKTPATQLKSTTNVMALRTKIQTLSRKQDFNIQMHIKDDLDVRNSTMGICST
jgi:hypothetical protein